MVAYRKYTVDACSTEGDSDVDHWWTNGHNQIAFGCADKGFVVINNQDGPLAQRLSSKRIPPSSSVRTVPLSRPVAVGLFG